MSAWVCHEESSMRDMKAYIEALPDTVTNLTVARQGIASYFVIYLSP
jgi:hypothetical protein